MTNYNERLDEILARHNGELGVTWEDPDVVTPDTKQAILDWRNKQIESLYELLDEVVEPMDDDCSYDHHGNCQSHFLHGDPCPYARAKALVAERNKLKELR